MYLSKLEIQGFKSFAEKVVLEFNKELTAIVGPNGSGKSNVADAVRWVLGEQSLKLLRGKKSQDVIFAGSSKKSRLGFAEVNLYLDNSDGSAPLDYKEIVITRRIYRDGEGEYLINKNKVRLTDIQLMLAKASFGQRSYSIIGQGMIDTILTSSPAERKELFDEATGVRQFQIKKNQAVLKLERSQENLTQSQQLMQEIEPRLRSLTRQVKKLEKKEEIQKKLTILQGKYYSKLIGDLNLKRNELDKSLTSAETDKAYFENQIADFQKQIDAEQTGDTEAGAFQKLQTNYQLLVEEKNQLTQELTLINGKIDLDLTKAGKVDLVWLKNKQSEVNTKLEATFQKLENYKQNQTRHQKLLDEKILEQQDTLEEFNILQQKLLEAQKNLSKKDKISIVKIKQHLNELYEQQHEFIEYLNKNNGQIDLQKIKNKATKLLEEIKNLTGQLEEEKVTGTEDIFRLQEKINSFIVSKDSLVNEIQEIKINLEIAKQKVSQAQEEHQNLHEEQKKIANELTTSNGNGGEASSILNKQQSETEAKINEINSQLNKLQDGLQKFSKDQEEKKNKFIAIQKNLRHQQISLNSHNTKINEIKIELAKLETRQEELEKEITIEFIGQFSPLSEKFEINLGEAAAEIARLKNQLAVIGGIDDEVVEEYKEVKERHTFLSEQTIDLQNAIESCGQLIEELDEKITKQFEEAFKKINEKFQHYFKILFEGGNAKLILSKKEIVEPEIINGNGNGNDNIKNSNESAAEDSSSEPKKDKKVRYEFGIEIQATPPGKKLKSINMLSGGEKALTSIALVSAIIANNPSPFVVLDEVDAALDEANSERFAKIIEELSDRTQFICITHNRATMHQAAILYGTTMRDDGVSKLLSINMKEAEKVAE